MDLKDSQEVNQFYGFCCPFLSVLLCRKILPQEGPMVTNDYDLVIFTMGVCE